MLCSRYSNLFIADLIGSLESLLNVESWSNRLALVGKVPNLFLSWVMISLTDLSWFLSNMSKAIPSSVWDNIDLVASSDIFLAFTNCDNFFQNWYRVIFWFSGLNFGSPSTSLMSTLCSSPNGGRSRYSSSSSSFCFSRMFIMLFARSVSSLLISLIACIICVAALVCLNLS